MTLTWENAHFAGAILFLSISFLLTVQHPRTFSIVVTLTELGKLLWKFERPARQPLTPEANSVLKQMNRG